jgi:hypothetical protein
MAHAARLPHDQPKAVFFGVAHVREASLLQFSSQAGTLHGLFWWYIYELVRAICDFMVLAQSTLAEPCNAALASRASVWLLDGS